MILVDGRYCRATAVQCTLSSNCYRPNASNGLNQYGAEGPASFTLRHARGRPYDPKGNFTSEGTNSYTHSSENLPTSAPGGTVLTYDPVMRLYDVTSAATTRFAYDSRHMIAEYDAASALQRR